MLPPGVYLPGPPGYPLYRLPDPTRFTLTASLEPPGIFGAVDGNHLVLPAPAGGMGEEQLNVDGVEKGVIQSALPASALAYSSEKKGVSFVMTSNQIELSGMGMKAFIVRDQLIDRLKRLLRGLTVSTGIPFRARLKTFVDESGTNHGLPSSIVIDASIYELKRLEENLAWSIDTLDCDDVTLARAVHYFCCAVRYSESWEAFIRARSGTGILVGEDFEDSLWAAAFLGFYKAITVILDEPSNSPRRNARFAGRAKALGLKRVDTRLIWALKNVRDDFDVAHRAEDPLAHPLPRRNVEIAEQLARQVIRLYTTRIQSGKPPFGSHPLRVHQARGSKRSSLKRLGPSPKHSIRRFVVEHSYGAPGTYNEDLRFFGRDISIVKLPLGRPAKSETEPSQRSNGG